MKDFHRRGAEDAEKGFKAERSSIYVVSNSLGYEELQLNSINLDLLFLCVLCVSAVNMV